LNLISFKDIIKEIRKICQFLDKKLTDEQIDKLVDHVKVDIFSKNASVNMTMDSPTKGILSSAKDKRATGRTTSVRI
jgi:uncharacterized protein YqeY